MIPSEHGCAANQNSRAVSNNKSASAQREIAMVRVILAGILAIGASVAANATPVFSESFDSVAGLGALGWLQRNNSSPAGETGWFQGNSGVFASQSGAADSYVAA